MKKYLTIYFLDFKNALIHLSDSKTKNIVVPFYFEPYPFEVGQVVEVETDGDKITRLKPLTLDSMLVQSYIICQPDFVHPLEKSHYTVTLERRSQREGEDKWGIFKNNSVLFKSLKDFGYESMPSSRTDESLADTRFQSAQEAFIFWKQVAEPIYIQEIKEHIELIKNNKSKPL